MSGNQKQAAAGGPQTQRFANPNNNYPPLQPQQPQRADGFAVSSPTPYLQQPNQGGNQGPGLRAGIAPTGPPNQASTPPNSDIKVQSLQQPTLYVRTSNQNYYNRSPPGPPNQPARMQNHNRPPQPQIYSQPPNVGFMGGIPPQMYLTPAAFYNSGGQRQQNLFQPLMHPLMHPQAFAPTNYASPPATYYNYMVRPQQQQSSAPPNPAQPAIPSLPIQQAAPQHAPPFQPQRQVNRGRRPNAISIIDPDTGKDRLNEVFGENSHPASGESSARQTPQPGSGGPPANQPHPQQQQQQPNSKEMQNTFARQVAQALGSDSIAQQQQQHQMDHHQPQSAVDYRHHHEPPPAPVQVVQEDPVDPTHYPGPQPVPVSPYDIAQSSKLKVQAKEFISNSKSSKETTPIVSANCDAAEVTLPSKPPKSDRESPVKGRKKDRGGVAAPTAAPAAEKEAAATAPPAEDKPSEAAAVGSTNVGSTQPEKKKEEGKKDAAKGADAKELSPDGDGAHQETAKSKNQANKIINQQQQQSQVGKQTGQKGNNVAAVPASQPKNSNSKGSKKTDLNQKGASKEGTDMDAISDVAVSNEDATNANAKPAAADAINANSVQPAAPAPAAAADLNENTAPAAKSKDPIAITTTTTISKSEKQSKPMFDVLSIVKDQPPPKISTAPQPKPAASEDEPDRAAISSNERLVQAKNEANAKETNNSNADNLKYEDGQWSPFNKDGKKVYNREFLFSLKDAPASKLKPNNIYDAISFDENNRRQQEGRFSSLSGRGTDFSNPPYIKSNSQKGGVLPKRNSQSGKLGGSGKNNKMPGKLSISLSIRDDVKLNLTENAWKPARLNAKPETASDEDKKTAELYKKVRGVLNKLTPQKFDTLVTQVRTLKIGNADRLQGVIDLVFEKAVDEPNFSVAYALMCRELALIQVPTANSKPEAPEFVNFRKLLITRCQMEFEKQSVDESTREVKMKEIEATADADKKKDLQFELDEHDRKLRMKSVGNIRFIGELFKQQMLTVNIMLRCLHNLLDNKDEESLECLCKLLTTIGKELETKNVPLEPIFKVMRDIVERRSIKVSSRVKFMLQDVIDLRGAKWVPRRQDVNPKTIDQIQKEAQDEQNNIAAMNSMPAQRKDDRGGGGNQNSNSGDRGGGGKQRKNNVGDDGWIQTGRNHRAQQHFSVQSDKLKSKPPQMEEMSLGSANLFNTWGKGSNIKNVVAPPMGAQSNNIYAALEKEASDSYTQEKKSGGGNRRDAYHSKGHSLERNSSQRGGYDGRAPPPQQQQQHRGPPQQQQHQQPAAPVPAAAAPAAAVAPPPAAVKPPQAREQLSEEQLERRFKNALDEYVSDNIGVDEFDQEIRACVPDDYVPKLINNCICNILEKTRPARVKTGELLANLIKLDTVSLESFSTGLQETFDIADDMVIDIPMFWQYLAEILHSLICMEVLPLTRLHKMLEGLGQDHHYRFVGTLLLTVAEAKGQGFLKSLWQVSQLRLTDVTGGKEPESFVRDFKLEFLNDANTPAGEGEFTYDQIQAKLTEFFINKKNVDEIGSWIGANVGDRVKENKFIRALVTAILKDSIKKDSLSVEIFHRHLVLLQKYIDNNSESELQCLYAVQSLVNEMEHPKGLLLSIVNNLYEPWAISLESFLAWEASTDPAEQAGKGVALKQLNQFLTELKDDQEDSNSDE
ncbi:unnamed protein product [Brassicogethes aeneus]|uniref:Uncharacterized protein n=1 Tax=Brassicogethes aeneus TaxID=1431903 RepID=A0A9P0FIJ6_BRAAE|nr:unnamed protein product [Brassicogethes aeneus]